MDALLDRLMVKFRAWDAGQIERVASEVGGKVVLRMEPIRWVVVEIDPSAASDLFQAYAARPEVEDLYFDEVGAPHSTEPWAAPAVSAAGAGDASIVDAFWTLKVMNVHAAWKYSKGAGVRVSACDSGFSNRTHPWYVGKDLVHWNSVYNAQFAAVFDENLEDVTFDKGAQGVPAFIAHGEGVLGIMSLIAPEAALCNMRHTDANGSTGSSNYVASLLASYNTFGCRVLNLSWGSSSFGGNNAAAALATNTPWRDALYYLRDHGVIACFSAGNGAIASEPSLGFPAPASQAPAAFAPLTGHLGVAAIGPEDGRPVAYSNCGSVYNGAAPTRTWVACSDTMQIPAAALPGVDLTNWPFGIRDGASILYRYRNFDGTSGSAPAMAGVCALVISAYPGIGGEQARDIVLETGFRGDHSDFATKLPNARIPDALRAVLKAKSLDPANAGVVFSYLSFRGRGVRVDVDPATLESTTHLGGLVKVVVGAYSSNAITRVEMWAGSEIVYSGPPHTWDAPLLLSTDRLAGRVLKVIGYTATGSGEVTYTGVTIHPTGSTLPPTTRASLSPGTYSPSTLITLDVSSDALPVRTQYRWDNSPWQVYSAAIPVRSGRLEFYSVDCNGNVEGGVDYAVL